VTGDQTRNRAWFVAILRMHRALCIARASHVNGRNAYTHNILFSRFISSRTIATSHRDRHAFLAPYNHDKRVLGQFPHGTNLISQRSRGVSWSWKTREFVEAPDNEEDAAWAAILDKVMKGRQPTELMLRCECCEPRI
jgi:hypothetical protein